MALRGTDPDSYITEYTLAYEDKAFCRNFRRTILKEEKMFLDEVSPRALVRCPTELPLRSARRSSSTHT